MAALTAKILRVYIEALTGFSHVFSPDGLDSTLLSQGCILETAPTVGTVGRMYIPMTEERVRSFRMLGSSLWVNQQSHPLNDLFQQRI